MSEAASETFSVTLTHQGGYAFDIDFHDGSGVTLRVDEPSPLGEGSGPNAARVLASAIGHCLSASLLFCLAKARVDVRDIKTTVSGSLTRNERGRLRLGPLKVRIEPITPGAPAARLGRCLEIFEDFCIVTASARDGLQVDVEVAAPAGASVG
jgi:organic hydroperoxide reductase OsmC/OhrA